MTTNQPIPNSTYIGDLIPSRFLKVEDLTERWGVEQMAITISRVEKVDTIPNAKDIDPTTGKPRIIMQTVLYFKNKAGKEFHRGYLLTAREDLESLISATAAKTAGDLLGKRILIFISEFRKKPVLRIAPTPPEEPTGGHATKEGEHIAREQMQEPPAELTYKKSEGAPDLPPMPSITE